MPNDDGLYTRGLVKIYCKVCEEVICETVYKGFTTATCAKCAKVNPAKEAVPAVNQSMSEFEAEQERKAEARDFEKFYQLYGRPVVSTMAAVREKMDDVVEATAEVVVKVVKKIVGKKIKLKEPIEETKRRKTNVKNT